MFGFHRLAIVVVVVAGGVTAYSVDQSRRPTDRIGSPRESSQTPIARSEIDPGVREAERSRRPHRPADQQRKSLGADYDSVLKGSDDGAPPRTSPPEPMPPTHCSSIRPVEKRTEDRGGPYRVHDQTVYMFENASGFGFARLAYRGNKRGILVASKDVDRVELVSLLTDYDESVYVLDEMATPAKARKAARRPLDEFERLGLDAVRRGENLVWTPEAPTRMFGAIRARESCLECHTDAKKGDLLGAFTYYLEVPVDRLSVD